MTLRLGAQGQAVRYLQQRLSAAGFGPLRDDGIMGPATVSSLRLFQGAARPRLAVDGIAGPATMAALTRWEVEAAEKPSTRYPPIILACEKLGHPIHVDGQINIIGIRSSTREAGAFDDWMHLAWVDGGLWHIRRYPITTDPGLPWLAAGTERGTAILCPGSWPVYTFDLHQGRAGYRTLCQRAGTVQCFRDGDGDAILDMDPKKITEGWFGINIHHAGEDSSIVGRWSAGCQVFARKSDWAEAMDICEASGAEVFTYTLINEEEMS